MCESRVYAVLGEGERYLLMEDVISVEVSEDCVLLRSIRGERNIIKGAFLTKVDLLRHEILLRVGEDSMVLRDVSEGDTAKGRSGTV